jgi:hypothetical protein
MAFPAFDSAMYDERMRGLQGRERNFFENIGLESSWQLELLPDQPFDLARITDIRVWFQYEALFDENLKRLVTAKRYAGRTEMVALPIGRTLREAGGSVDFASPLEIVTTRALFENPALEKTIVDAGFAIRLHDGKTPGGAITLEVSCDGAAPVTVQTTEAGVVATAPDHPAGTGLAELAALVQGRSVATRWTLRLAAVPTGLGFADVEEVFLMLNCRYGA